MQPGSPTKGKPRVNTSSATKRQGASMRSGTVNLVEDCPTLPAIEHRALQDQLIELEHLRGLNIECLRERGVTQSVQTDVGMVR